MDKLRNCIKEAISKLDRNENISDKLLEEISKHVNKITREHELKYPEDAYKLKEHFEYLYDIFKEDPSIINKINILKFYIECLSNPNKNIAQDFVCVIELITLLNLIKPEVLELQNLKKSFSPIFRPSRQVKHSKRKKSKNKKRKISKKKSIRRM